jgi:hypothetical protein
MRIIVSESQLKRLLFEQQQTKEDFDEFLNNFNEITFKEKKYKPEEFLDKLNASPIRLNMFHITTDGYKIGTGSVSAEGTYKNTNIILSVKPVGDFKTAMVSITKKF